LDRSNKYKLKNENCPRGGTHAHIGWAGGRCIKCGRIEETVSDLWNDDYEAINLKEGLLTLRRLGLDTGDWLGQILNRLPETSDIKPNKTVDEQIEWSMRTINKEKDNLEEALRKTRQVIINTKRFLKDMPHFPWKPDKNGILDYSLWSYHQEAVLSGCDVGIDAANSVLKDKKKEK